MGLEPAARRRVIGTGCLYQPPVRGRVVQTAQVHQFVNQHVVTHPRRHQHQAPVQADVAALRAGPPSRPLVPHAHARHPQPQLHRHFGQPRRQLALRPRAQGSVVLSRTGQGLQPRALLGNPGGVLVREPVGFTTRAPARNRDADATVVLHSKEVPSGATVPDERDGPELGRRPAEPLSEDIGDKRQMQLHRDQDTRFDSGRTRRGGRRRVSLDA